MSYGYAPQRGQISRTLCCEKRANLGRSHTVQSHFYDTLEMTQLLRWRTDRGLPEAGGRAGKGETVKEYAHETSPILYYPCGGGAQICACDGMTENGKQAFYQRQLPDLDTAL